MNAPKKRASPPKGRKEKERMHAERMRGHTRAAKPKEIQSGRRSADGRRRPACPDQNIKKAYGLWKRRCAECCLTGGVIVTQTDIADVMGFAALKARQRGRYRRLGNRNRRRRFDIVLHGTVQIIRRDDGGGRFGAAGIQQRIRRNHTFQLLSGILFSGYAGKGRHDREKMTAFPPFR